MHPQTASIFVAIFVTISRMLPRVCLLNIKIPRIKTPQKNHALHGSGSSTSNHIDPFEAKLACGGQKAGVVGMDFLEGIFRRWGIEEWHRGLKNGCGVEQREFKTAEHLQWVLAFDLIVAWRVLARVKPGRTLPQLAASVLYSPEELKVLLAAVKKTSAQKRRGGLLWAKPTSRSPSPEATWQERATARQGPRVSAWACAD